MRVSQLFTASSVLGLLLGTFAAAEEAGSNEQLSFLEIARLHCSPQVEALLDADKEIANQATDSSMEWDSRIPDDQHIAFNKYSAWAVVAASQASAFLVQMYAIEEGEPAPEKWMKSYLPLLELSECMLLSQKERELFREAIIFLNNLEPIVKEMTEDEARASADHLLEKLEEVECKHWYEASRQIYEIEPGSKDAETKMWAALQDTIGQCEKKFESLFQRKS